MRAQSTKMNHIIVSGGLHCPFVKFVMIPIRPGFYGNLRQYVNVKTLIKKEVKKPGQAALAAQ